MNAITQSLLAGAALGALITTPALAGNVPPLTITALHGGNVVNKTQLHDPSRQHLTYTYFIYSSVQMELHEKMQVGGLYKWNSAPNGSWTLCSNPKTTIKFDPKKTLYGKQSAFTETYSYGCPSGPTTFYGFDYKLTDPNGFGHTDHFRSSLIGKFKGPDGYIYKGTLNLDDTLTIQK